jgi:hypothetical protein
MTVKFDMVRIGKIRKSPVAEMFLKENVQILQQSIRDLLADVSNESDQVDIAMVIPAKGYSIKIILEFFHNEQIKHLLQTTFPNSIYRRDTNNLVNHVHNRIF